ncbi:MAG: hypothetical protein ACYTE5_07385 [Planctomycetota bacterium]|jgi:hypothetical protein
MMEQEDKGEVEQIIAQMECGKDFECYRSGLERLCKARDDGLKNYVRCLEEHNVSLDCRFSLWFGDGMLCKCPLRIYIAKRLKK